MITLYDIKWQLAKDNQYQFRPNVPQFVLPCILSFLTGEPTIQTPQSFSPEKSTVKWEFNLSLFPGKYIAYLIYTPEEIKIRAQNLLTQEPLTLVCSPSRARFGELYSVFWGWLFSQILSDSDKMFFTKKLSLLGYQWEGVPRLSEIFMVLEHLRVQKEGFESFSGVYSAFNGVFLPYGIILKNKAGSYELSGRFEELSFLDLFSLYSFLSTRQDLQFQNFRGGA